MTGSKPSLHRGRGFYTPGSALQTWGIGGLVSLLLALPAGAQTPVTPAPPVSLPSVAVQYDSVNGTPADAQIDGFRLLYGGELSVQAGHAQGSLTKRQFAATGHVRVHETDTTLLSDSLLYNAGRAEATHTLLTQNPFTLTTPRLVFAPGKAFAEDVRAAAVPPGVRPDLFLRAGEVRVFPAQHKGEVRRASLYLFGGRLLTVRRIGFGVGGGSSSAVNRRQGVFPTAGASARYGPFVGFGGTFPGVRAARLHLLLPTRRQPQIRITAHQSLLSPPPAPASPPLPSSGSLFLDSVRAVATARKPPLPYHDPLLFHTILPSPDPIQPFGGPPRPGLTLSEEVTSHIERAGRLRSDLSVSGLPDVSLSGSLPLVHQSAPTPYGDPDAFRRALRQIVPIVTAQVGVGFYREERPGDTVSRVRSTRQQAVLGLSLAPLLVAPNTLLLPRVQTTHNFYDKSPRAYSYTQASVAVERDFSPYSSVGVQLLTADTHGDSPFDFDVLDTSRELDGRLQLGSRRLTLAGEVRYDLRRGGVIEYRLSAAPGLNGIRPILSYNSRTGAFGINAELPGPSF